MAAFTREIRPRELPKYPMSCHLTSWAAPAIPARKRNCGSKQQHEAPDLVVGKDKARGRKDAAIKRYVGGLNSRPFVKADGLVDLQ